MNILMTGGLGFIGSSLIRELVKRNDVEKILIFDNFERNSLQFQNDYNKNPKIEIHDVNILNTNRLKYCLNSNDFDIVIHLAALCGVDNVISRPVRTMEVNTIGTYNIMKCLSEKSKKIKKFINFSTSEVYGSYSYKLGENEKTSLGAVGEARWVYSISKLLSEHMCFAFQKEYNIPICSIRPFNIYGPNQVGEGAIHIFITNCILSKDINIHGDGSQIRSWCYIDDVVSFIEKVIDSDNVNGQVLNMGNPAGTITTIGLAQKIIKITKSNSKIKYTPIPYTDVELRIPNIEKAKVLLNYEPKVSLDDGILKTFEWYKQKYNLNVTNKK